MRELENILRDILWNDKGEDFYEQANNVIKKVKQLEAENKQIKESIRYAIGGIDALLPKNKDVLAIKQTLEQAKGLS